LGDVQSKYGNRKTVVDGITFDSKKEADRYIELKYMERAGLIRCLELQPKYCLIPTLEGSNGKIAQRAVYYRADFEYLEKDGNGWRRVVEDVKSPATKTQVYLLKKKLMRWRLGIEIREV
jgi:hypothetical protein